jgi:acyl-CoA reductase-like NAD-dependent aldehyde dehydrogenase
MQAIQEQLNAPLLCVSEVDGFDTFKTEVEDNKYGTGLRIFTKEPTSYRNLVSQL